MKHIENLHINGYSGYLKCLSRLCGNRYSFNVSCYEADIEIDSLIKEITEYWSTGDEYVEPCLHYYQEREEIEVSQIFTEIESYIFNVFLNLEEMDSDDAINYAKKTLSYDINEYYGLVSTSLNENGAFHPLNSNKVYRIFIDCQKHERSFYFIVKIENIYVLTSFIMNANIKK